MFLGGILLLVVAILTLIGVVRSARREFVDDEARTGLLRAYLIASTPLGPMFTAFFLIFDAPWAAIGPAAFFGFTLASWFCLKRKKPQLAATLLVYGIWISPTWAAMATGGLFSGLIIWTAPAPFMGGPLLGRSASLVLGAAAVTAALVMGLAPNLPPGVVEMSAEPARTLVYVLCAMSAIGLLAFYGYSTTRSYYENARRLEEQHAQIAATSAELEVANDGMRAVLDSVSEGLVMVDGQGRIFGRWSAQIDSWFRRPQEGDHFWGLFDAADANAAAMVEIGFEDLESGFMPAEVVLNQLPARVRVGEQVLSMEVAPEGENYLVVFRDISAQLAKAQLEQEQRQILALVQKYQVDPPGTRNFVAEVDGVIAELSTTQGAALAGRLHTAKGNAGVYGLHRLAEMCHEAEDAFAAEGEMTAALAADIQQHWAHLKQRFHALVGTGSAVHISSEEIVRLQGAVEGGASRDRIASLVAELRWQPVGPALRRLGEQAQQLGERLGKPDLVVRYIGGDVRLPPERFAPIFSALTHATRNAVGHGVEMPESRLAQGKSAHGSISLSVTRRGDSVVTISVSDDGAGVAWDKIRAKASALGLPTDTPADLRRALFANGLSTADGVTELSGRGVGSRALLDVVERMGGQISIESVVGAGATVQCEVPLRSNSTTSTSTSSRPIPLRIPA